MPTDLRWETSGACALVIAAWRSFHFDVLFGETAAGWSLRTTMTLCVFAEAAPVLLAAVEAADVEVDAPVVRDEAFRTSADYAT